MLIGFVLGFLAGILFLAIISCMFAAGEESENKENKQK